MIPPPPISWGTQASRHGSKFQGIGSSLQRFLKGADLSDSPSEITPDRALVFEVIGPIQNLTRFIRAVSASGFEWLGEDLDLSPSEADDDEDEDDDHKGSTEKSTLYITMPSVAGLQKILSMWERYSTNKSKPAGVDGAWWSLFDYLSDIRVWSAVDRVDPFMAGYLDRMAARDPNRPVRVEVDLWYRSNPDLRAAAQDYARVLAAELGGSILDFVTIKPIQYQAALFEIPAAQAQMLRQLQGRLANAAGVMRVRPQSLHSDSAEVDVLEPDGDVALPTYVPAVARPAVAALIDGYPVERHDLLANRLIIHEVDVAAIDAPVNKRRHGTAMASLILHGDLGTTDVALSRPLAVVPVLSAEPNAAEECTPRDKLPIGLIYRAVTALVKGSALPSDRIVIINHSICDREAPFANRASYWAKLLDYLAHEYRLLFIVSAGNSNPPFLLDTYATSLDFETGNTNERQVVLLRCVEQARAFRSILSPAETLNGITVGALHGDKSTGLPDDTIEPFDTVIEVANLTSGMGLGINRAIKPDFTELGGRQLVRTDDTNGSVSAWAYDHPDVGQVTASPDPSSGRSNLRTRSSGTSNAAALTTRSAVQLADIIEELFEQDGDEWHRQKTRAVVLKTLLAHGCSWGETGKLLKSVYGGKPNQVKEAVVRVLGYGKTNHSRVFSSEGSRITLLADDIIKSGALHEYRLPVPRAMINSKELRRLILTLSWSSPIAPAARQYRGVNVEIIDVNGNRKFWTGVKNTFAPTVHTGRRGTLQHIVLEGKSLIRPGGDADFFVGIQANTTLKDFQNAEVPYALAATLELADSVRTDVFTDVLERVRPKHVAVPERVRVRG